MTTILTRFRKNGFDFEQIERRGMIAVFKKQKSGKCVSFEVIKISTHNGYEIAGVRVPAGEFYPSDESWGSWGFTFNDLDSALNKMKQMEETR